MSAITSSEVVRAAPLKTDATFQFNSLSETWNLQAAEQASQVHSRANHYVYCAYAKRVIDVVAAGVLLVLLTPVLLAAVIWIILDCRANPFFTQRRIGRDGVAFRLLKLRTMDSSASVDLVWLIDDRGVRRHKVRHDPRVTRPGRFLRRTSIDELPQLVNVLRGEMSLVGPRPELPEIVAGYAPWQHARHAVRPGLTGWWQVSGRSDAPMHEHTELDMFYVERVSPRLDLLIALKTIRVVVKGLGAF